MTADEPAPRWLFVLTLVAVLVFSVLRLMLAAQLDFRSDEAYYWTWSRQWVLSYLDQPPMVAWFQRLGQLLFGDTTLGARFAQLVSLPLIEVLLADIARRRTGSWSAALFLVLALELSTYYSMFVVVLEPSIPMMLFLSVMLWGMVRLDETMDGRWWLLVGLAGGLALLSKYLVVLLAPALLVLLLSPRHRRWLATPWPYASMLLALLVFSPVLVWNVRHDWISISFQSERLGPGTRAIGFDYLLGFIALDGIGVGLVLAVAAVVGSIRLGLRAIRTRDALDAALASAFLFPAIVLGVRSLTAPINMSWGYFMWPLGALALVVVIDWKRRLAWRLLLAGVALTSLPLTGALFYHALFDREVWLGRADPFGSDAGFDSQAESVLTAAEQNGAKWIATSDYRTYANLLWHIGDRIPILQINERARFLDFALPTGPSFAGPALYVHHGDASPLLAEATLTPLGAIPAVWRGMEMSTIAVERLDNYVAELDPPPLSPGYIATP